MKQALTVLGEAWPQTIGFADLVDGVAGGSKSATRAEVDRVLTDAVWELYGAGALDLRCTAPRCVKRAGEQPSASLLARLRLGDAGETVNQHHEFVLMTDALSRALFAVLDGTKDRQQLIDGLGTALRSGRLPASPAERDNLSAVNEQRLTAWGAHALLLA